MDLYLVRHAIKEKAMGDVSITEEGIEQARLTAEYFRHVPLVSVLSSPLKRAQHTAEYITQSHNLPVQIDRRLRERANWGDLPGQTFEEFVEIWDRCTKNPDYIPPAGDSARQACKRLSSLLDDVVRQYPLDSSIVLVTHGGLITDYMANTFPEDILNLYHAGFIAEQSHLIPECSITQLKYDNNELSITQFAYVDHLKN